MQFACDAHSKLKTKKRQWVWNIKYLLLRVFLCTLILMGNNNYCALSKTHLDWEIKSQHMGMGTSWCTCLIPIMLIEPEEMHQWKKEREGEPQKPHIKGPLEGSVSLGSRWINSIKISQNKYASRTEKQSPKGFHRKELAKLTPVSLPACGKTSRWLGTLWGSPGNQHPWETPPVCAFLMGRWLAFLLFSLFANSNPPLNCPHNHSALHTSPWSKYNSEPHLHVTHRKGYGPPASD